MGGAGARRDGEEVSGSVLSSNKSRESVLAAKTANQIRWNALVVLHGSNLTRARVAWPWSAGKIGGHSTMRCIRKSVVKRVGLTKANRVRWFTRSYLTTTKERERQGRSR
jgi:hypothetical protein